MQVHYDEGVGAARLAVILAGVRVPPAEESSLARRKLGSRPRARGSATRDARRFDHSSMSQTASLA